MGNVKIDVYKGDHREWDARDLRVSMAGVGFDSTSQLCSDYLWQQVVLACSGTVPQFRAALVAAFGEGWVSSLPEREIAEPNVLVLVRLMQRIPVP